MTNQNQNKPFAWIRATTIAGAIVFAVLLGQVLLTSPAAQAQLASWKLIPIPQTYTELYFDNNVSLPTVVTSKPISFDFSVHNMEGKTLTYPYDVSVSGTGFRTEQVAVGTVELSFGETAVVPIFLKLPTGATTAVVMVSLPNQKQQVDFRLGASK